MRKGISLDSFKIKKNQIKLGLILEIVVLNLLGIFIGEEIQIRL